MHLGGAQLGTRITATVTIAKSDYPNGKFGFKGQNELTIENPDVAKTVTLTLERTGGLIGRQTVSILHKTGAYINFQLSNSLFFNKYFSYSPEGRILQLF